MCVRLGGRCCGTFGVPLVDGCSAVVGIGVGAVRRGAVAARDAAEPGRCLTVGTDSFTVDCDLTRASTFTSTRSADDGSPGGTNACCTTFGV